MAFQGATSVSTAFAFDKAVAGVIDVATAAYGHSQTYAWTVGVGVSQFNQGWAGNGTLAATPTTLVLSSLIGTAGTLTNARCKEIIIYNDADKTSGSANVLTVGPGATFGWTNAFAGDVKIRAGGCLALVDPTAAGYVIAAGSNEQLKLDPGAGTVPYRVVMKLCNA